MKNEKEIKITKNQFVESVNCIVQDNSSLAELFKLLFARGE